MPRIDISTDSEIRSLGARGYGEGRLGCDYLMDKGLLPGVMINVLELDRCDCCKYCEYIKATNMHIIQ